MYVSARLDYGLRALAILASQPDQPLSATRLAESLGVSVPYLVPAVLNHLRHQGLIVSERGRHAGCRLARPAADITVADVVSALHVHPVEVHESSKPPDEVGTRLAELWQQLDNAAHDLLASVSLADVIQDSSPAAGRSRRLEDGANVRRPGPVSLG